MSVSVLSLDKLHVGPDARGRYVAWVPCYEHNRGYGPSEEVAVSPAELLPPSQLALTVEGRGRATQLIPTGLFPPQPLP